MNIILGNLILFESQFYQAVAQFRYHIWVLSALPGSGDTRTVGKPGLVLLTTVRYGVGWLSWALLKRLPPATLDHHCHWLWMSHLVPVGILHFCSIGCRSEVFHNFFLIFFPSIPGDSRSGSVTGLVTFSIHQAPSMAYMGD